MKTTIDIASRKVPAPTNNIVLTDAKNWIGRRMVLKSAWLGFAPGTRCRVMCVVDFGDGLLLWLVTDDEHVRDVDQLEISFIAKLFSVLPVPLSGNGLALNKTTIAQSVN